METISALGILCLVAVAGLGAFIWTVIARSRERKNAAEIVALEVAVCIQKTNGDILIRQRRGKSMIGLLLGLSLILGSLALTIGQLLDPEAFWMDNKIR